MQVYCLPDMYEVEDRSLDVIRHVLNPLFKPEEVRAIAALHRLEPDPPLRMPEHTVPITVIYVCRLPCWSTAAALHRCYAQLLMQSLPMQ